jgi:uncharacterized protein DUF6968
MRVELNNIGDEIGNRLLSCVDANGQSSTVRVAMGKPERFEESDALYCPFQILGLGNPAPKYAVGADAIQAITLALDMIRVELEVRQQELKIRLGWAGSSDLGF